ncbi:uncharacterized protein BT62DRAFT_926239 [Guyanagaster necrorhizus]|uniref:DUF7918 domain-containing protein n=1 Tax=Guyanagaster necrorhizus TaxID=856835 RepID=A0A9P7W3L8_9AGAR|nr:uncharacterized protein BT62DRAFT_926239 [Guyanagaster necrorhizus MCA 3950]KAG7452023.1 hypothetical protein BT62DRAFT_926239 [Guyanagaster necrorhizus MCA 3950]
MVRFESTLAWISVGGVSLPGFGEEVSHADKKVTCWIPSEAGKAFCINWKHEDLYRVDCREGRACVDGKFVAGMILDPSSRRNTARVTGINSSAVTEKPMLFTSLELTDDDEYLHNSTLPELGEIKINIWRVQELFLRLSEPQVLMRWGRSTSALRRLYRIVSSGCSSNSALYIVLSL